MAKRVNGKDAHTGNSQTKTGKAIYQIFLGFTRSHVWHTDHCGQHSNLPGILSQYGPLDAVPLGGGVLGEPGAADVPDRPEQVEYLGPRRRAAPSHRLGPAELEDVVLVDGERAAGGVDVGEGRLGLLAGLDEGDLAARPAAAAGGHLVADVPDVGLGGHKALLLLRERLDLGRPDGLQPRQQLLGSKPIEIFWPDFWLNNGFKTF